MKTILLFAHDDAGQEARLRAALAVARACGGHLTCLDVAIEPTRCDEFVSHAAGALVFAGETHAEERHRQRLERRLASEDVSFDMVAASGNPADCIAKSATLVDLVVTSSRLGHENIHDLGSLAGDTVVRSGKPVLAVPATLETFDLRGRALIAWDGSREAEAALLAAIPLLRHARHVELFHFEDGSLHLPPEDAARYLSRNGIASVIRREPARHGRPGPALRREARCGHFDYVVMGAFGHNRLVERLFGGTTEYMLARSPVPLLLCSRR